MKSVKFSESCWTSPIGNLMIWCTDRWNKCEIKTKLNLRVHYDQLLIIGNTKIIESLNLHSKIKGVYKDDILILIHNIPDCHEGRKIKFQLKGNVVHCIQKLSEYFPVINYKQNGKSPENIIQPKFRKIDEVLRIALESKENETSMSLPANFGSFVRLCLLDPTFPQVVLETEKILLSEKFKK